MPESNLIALIFFPYNFSPVFHVEFFFHATFSHLILPRDKLLRPPTILWTAGSVLIYYSSNFSLRYSRVRNMKTRAHNVIASFLSITRCLKSSHDMMTKHEVSALRVSTSRLPPRGSAAHYTIHFTLPTWPSPIIAEMSRGILHKSEIPAHVARHVGAWSPWSYIQNITFALPDLVDQRLRVE